MASEITKQAYRVGDLVFHISHSNAEFAGEIDKLLPHAVAAEESSVRDIKMGGSRDVKELISYILERHAGFLWTAAACLVSPGGKKLLVSGRAQSGKSTASLALALGFGWKVLSEDVTLFNPVTDQIVNLRVPFAVKSGTLEILRDSIAIAPEQLILNEWLPVHGLDADSNCDANIDFAVHLEFDPNAKSFDCQPLSLSQYLRKTLPTSNAVRINNGTDKFLKYLQNAGTYCFSAGSLVERLEKLAELTGVHSDVLCQQRSASFSGDRDGDFVTH